MHPIVTPNPNIQKSVPNTNPPGLSIPDSTLGPARLSSARLGPKPASTQAPDSTSYWLGSARTRPLNLDQSKLPRMTPSLLFLAVA